MAAGVQASLSVVAASIAALVAVGSAAAGLKLSRAPQVARRLIPLSGGLLGGLTLFGVLPELAERHGGLRAVGLIGAGLLALWAIGRWVYAICPACSHTHDHTRCTASLHGFALPLTAAASLHALLDGMGMAAATQEASQLGAAVVLGVALHKVPEGVALGVMLWAALDSRWVALGGTLGVQAWTVLGALVEAWAGRGLGSGWLSYPLALAGGSFLYLAYHTVHAEWRQRGAAAAFAPALMGGAAAALLQHGLRLWWR